MYRAFLSYNTAADEMVVVWRLQTLAAASGIHLDVPSQMQRSDWATVRRMIDDADAVIVFLTKRATAQVKNELSYALSRKKHTIPIVEQGASIEAIRALLQQFDIPIFWLDPDRPWEMEAKLARFVQKKKLIKTRDKPFSRLLEPLLVCCC